MILLFFCKIQTYLGEKWEITSISVGLWRKLAATCGMMAPPCAAKPSVRLSVHLESALLAFVF